MLLETASKQIFFLLAGSAMAIANNSSLASDLKGCSYEGIFYFDIVFNIDKAAYFEIIELISYLRCGWY